MCETKFHPCHRDLIMNDVRKILRNIYTQYKADIGLDSCASYLTGTPLRPVVPLDTAVGGLFILGAYPSARFAVVVGDQSNP